MFKVKQKLFSVLTTCLTMLATLVLAIATLTPVAAIADDATTSNGTWILVTDASTLSVGDKIVIAAKGYDYALGTTQNKNNRSATTIAKSGNTLLDISTSVQVITLESGTNYGTFAFYVEGDTTGYLSATTAKNKLQTESNISANSSFKITIENDKTNIAAQGSTTYYLKFNPNNGNGLFACYANGQQDVCIYKLETQGVDCDHTETKLVSNGDNTHNKVCANDNCGKILESNLSCTDNGEYTYNKNTADKNTETHKHLKQSTCTECNGVYSAEENCTFGEGEITAPTETEQGYTKYTCTVCGYYYKNNYTEPTAKYTVTYSVLGTKTTEIVAHNGKPSLPLQQNVGNYKFEGWTESAVDKATETKPVLVTDSYAVTDDVTFYAVYSLTQGSGNYVKVTENLDDWSGEYLIVYENKNIGYIFNGSLTALDVANNNVSATIADSTIASENSQYSFTIAKSGDNYTIQSKSGYYIGRTTTKNGLDINKTTQLTNTIQMDTNGTITITSNDTSLQFNNANNQMRFRYFTSTQKAIYLYRLDGKVEYMTNVPTVTASVTLGEEIKVNYNVTISETFEGATLQYSFNDGTAVYTATGVKNADGKYVYSIPVAPQMMTNVIHAKLVAQDGSVLVTPNDFSIRGYAQTLLQREDCSDTLKQLLTDLLTYGAEAQQYKNYKTDDWATDVEGLGTASAATPTENDKSTLVNGENATEFPAYFAKATVWFDNTNSIRVYVVGDCKNIKLTINNEEKTLTNVGENTYLFETNGLKATELDTVFAFRLYNGETLLQTLTYSVNAYTYNMQNNQNIGNLALALYRYGLSAKAYADANN